MPMVRFRRGFRWLSRLAAVLVGLTAAVAAGPAQARQVLLVTNFNAFTVGEYNATTGAAINGNFINNSQGLNGPEGLARDGNNHIFVTNVNTNTVGEYNATTGATVNATFITSGQGLAQPLGLLLDGLGHILVANYGNNTVGEYDASTGATVNAAFINGQGLNLPRGLALDGNNHLFVANVNNNTVGEYNATTGATINANFITGLGGPIGLMFVAPVPEPSSLLLVGSVTAAAVGVVRRKRLAARGPSEPEA
jgi:hypothetical protein